MAKDPRMAVVSALAGLHREKRYSNIVLDELLKSADLSAKDRAFASRLFYGVIERRITIDYLLQTASAKPLHKLHPLVLETLRTGVYQLLFMDKIPPSAAVNEAVAGIRRFKQGHASGFVNAVLRGVQRRQSDWQNCLPDGDAGLSVRYSCPVELIAFWRDAYGDACTASLLESINEVPPTYLRVNTLQMTDEQFADCLHERDIAYEQTADIPHCFELKSAYLGNKLETVDKNCYYYQDKASQYACRALDAQAGEAVADVCAAPGGKSFTVAQGMGNIGRILSCDVYPQKCDTIEKRAAQLGITILQTAVRDASAPCSATLCGTFDRVICDVPCSGLGVIRRKPEIRYKELQELRSLPALQYAILEQSAALVKSGGVLQYSTCTLNPAENEAVAERFLREHPEFQPRVLPLVDCFAAAGMEPSHCITLFPHIHGTDGFFIAGFEKK
ncbi:MAG: 16S rRNA (cytosine(967)-C(5))-methyltransferase RsmB [Clostridia bacterium]|nr:16S rRNA (cytosine(967)-C(5))-methyltransferase RsmB [Clostridia bacterium]